MGWIILIVAIIVGVFILMKVRSNHPDVKRREEEQMRKIREMYDKGYGDN